MSKVNPGRLAALKTLIAVERGDHAEDRLAELAPPTGPDRGLSWHLALGTLRWQGAIDHVLGPLLSRPLARLDPAVRCALRMGTFEAHMSNAPARAVVHQTVEAVKRVGMRRASGMVNAVLRKSVEAPLSPDPSLQLPPWLALRWGGHTEWLARIRKPAPLCIAGSNLEDLALQPATLQGGIMKDLWVLPSGSGAVTGVDGFDDGRFWVMDAAAAKVADAVVAATPKGGTVLDACAAPGGKTFRMTAAGLAVTSVDLSAERMQRLQHNASRLGIRVQTAVHDWLTGPLIGEQRYDSVLVDAPCTGLGTVRRHPEIIWRRQPGDPAAMSIAQRAILANAAKHVKPGGRLVYAVCSMEPEEGTEVATHLDGWSVEHRWASVPPAADEDGFQLFVLRANAT
ncbi:MAG: transcription antitermination factor NusB [Myxococcota bacterium]|nr:transcription antitermination factor NusB [Myxococcota bacterium]